MHYFTFIYIKFNFPCYCLVTSVYNDLFVFQSALSKVILLLAHFSGSFMNVLNNTDPIADPT